MNIAIFADLHGRILLAFKLCTRWERETGKKIDLILQAGDLGAFPHLDTLDKATRRYAEADPTELGFMNDFLQYDEDVATTLAQTSCPLIFVRGNHEAHRWLDKLEWQSQDTIFSIDAYQRLWCLRTGHPYTFQGQEEILTILGIGRIGAPAGETDNQQDKYIQNYEVEQIYTLPAHNIDLLLTHDSAQSVIKATRGMEEIRTVLNQYKPAYHFFGHYGGPARLQLDANNQTVACKLADLHWNRSTSALLLEEGSMAILSWKNSPGEHHLEILNLPWLKEYSLFTWNYV